MVTEPLGDQQMEVLQFVSDHAPVSVREVADQFAERRGLARTTILTVMERLREKGYLTRKKIAGVFHYSPAIRKPELLRSAVQQFVDRTLQGSLSPFLAYLADRVDVTEAEMEELRRIVSRLDAASGDTTAKDDDS